MSQRSYGLLLLPCSQGMVALSSDVLSLNGAPSEHLMLGKPPDGVWWSRARSNWTEPSPR